MHRERVGNSSDGKEKRIERREYGRGRKSETIHENEWRGKKKSVKENQEDNEGKELKGSARKGMVRKGVENKSKE